LGNTVRGKIIKVENQKEIALERNFLTRSYLLVLNKSLCNGCGLCAEICPHEAITVIPAVIDEGHLLIKPTINFDLDSCILCGECAVLCPLNALRMEVDKQEVSTFVKNEAFPVLLKEINVTTEKCDSVCELKCQDVCPTNAIKVSTKETENGKKGITNVQILKDSCFYCKSCEVACNLNAINVKKPFQGCLDLKRDLCPSDCMVCVEICPTDAIHLEKDKLVIATEFCLFCSACQKVCPENAIAVQRNWVFHTDINAAAWLTALKKLTSFETVRKNLMIKSGKRRSYIVKQRERQPHLKPKQVTSSRAVEFLEILKKHKKR